MESRSNFVTLQIEMRSLATKICAALLVGWYLIGVIGFDVHTCSGSGRSFIVSFFEGNACADVHPEHECEADECCGSHHNHDAGCCEDHSECPFCDGMSIESKSCCSNDYQMLTLAGTVPVEENGLSEWCSCGHCGFMISDAISHLDFIRPVSNVFWIIPDSGFKKACDRQAAFGVWRI